MSKHIEESFGAANLEAMQAPKHNYEPVGYDNAAFDSSISGRDTHARKNLNSLFQQENQDEDANRHRRRRDDIDDEDLDDQAAILETDIDLAPEFSAKQCVFPSREDEYVEISLDDEDEDNGNMPSTSKGFDANRLSKSLASLNTIDQHSHNLYPIDATTILCETDSITDETELKNSPLRTPSFKTAISSSETKLGTKKPTIIEPIRSCSSSNHKSKYSPHGVTSLPTSPRAVGQVTSTPGYSGAVNPQLSNSILSDNGICRICHEGDGNEELVAPCYCAGSVGVLHLTCLERWLGTSNTTRCEICQYQFKVERQSRSIWHVILKFLRHPSVAADRRNMLCDVVCFLILTPLTGISAFLCMMGVQHYAQWNGRWEVPGLAILTCFLLLIYAIWCCVAMRHHYKVCREWQNQNQIIKIRYLSPTKGKTIIEPKITLDKNQSHRSPSRQQLISPCTSTPSPHNHPSSFSRAMLRPILRYSAHLEAFSPPSSNPLDAHFSPHQISMIWGESDNRNSANIMMTSCLSEDILHAAKETYV